MVTSTVVIGKIRAEKHLNSHQLDFKTKTFKKKALAVSAHIPVFSLATVFRLGTLALLLTCLTTIPDPVNSLFFFHLSLFAIVSIMGLLLILFSRLYEPLANLMVLHACQELISECHLLELEFHLILSNFHCQVQCPLCLCGQV